MGDSILPTMIDQLWYLVVRLDLAVQVSEQDQNVIVRRLHRCRWVPLADCPLRMISLLHAEDHILLTSLVVAHLTTTPLKDF